MRHSQTLIRALAAGSLLALSHVAAAQSTAPGKWEVEVFGGAGSVNTPADGTSALPPAGANFVTVFGGLQSRHVSSWYFGDGSKFLNQVNSGLAARSGITALDPVLTAQSFERARGASAGVRVRRSLTRRLGLEFGYTQTTGLSRLRASEEPAVEASRASFIQAFNALLATGPFTAPNVTSTVTFDKGDDRRSFTTGALNINFDLAHGRVVPYATLGGGLLARSGDGAAFHLNGNYRFAIGNILPINESDAVTVRYVEPDRSFVTVLGAGVKFDAARKWGIRADARVHLSSYDGRIQVSATPSVTPGTPAGGINSATSPSLQFSNSTTFGPSTLSGAPIADFETFKGSGTRYDFAITGGWFFRF